MCIRAYLNGDGSGYKTHLSLFFVVMKGEYDALLKWPFDCKVSMILVGKENEGLVFMFCTCPHQVLVSFPGCYKLACQQSNLNAGLVLRVEYS